MECRHSGTGLMLAGAVVAVIGLGIALMQALQIPRYWVPFLVGVGLFLVGAVRWASTRRRT